MTKRSNPRAAATFRVLLVEDDPDWIDILRGDICHSLKKAGYSGSAQVCKAYSEGANALRERGPWDLLITDISFTAKKGKQGLSLVKDARELGIPCIVVSATLQPHDIRTIFKQLKARDFFEKDFINHDELTQAIVAVMEESEKPPVKQSSGGAKIIKGTRVFIGHGRSDQWRVLKDFLAERLKIPWDEFNRNSSVGYTTKERLEQILNQARFAFLVMTAEDEHADNTLHARENVVHEAGLFQGKLGFNKAIILLEEGCHEFSNILGLTHIPFPKGNIQAVFDEIRKVLEREEAIR